MPDGLSQSCNEAHTAAGLLRNANRRYLAAMLSDIDIWRSAVALMERYGANAGFEAAKRVEQLQEKADLEGGANWVRIFRAIERFRAERPDRSERLH